MPTSVNTFTATLYVGLRVGYTDRVHLPAAAAKVIQEYVDAVGLCVSVTETTFRYTRTPQTPHGYDPGLAVGFINYPRFPADPEQVRGHALTLGGKLKAALGQNRVTAVFPDETVMVGEADRPTPPPSAPAPESPAPGA